jgi:hypothetical protein
LIVDAKDIREAHDWNAGKRALGDMAMYCLVSNSQGKSWHRFHESNHNFDQEVSNLPKKYLLPC